MKTMMQLAKDVLAVDALGPCAATLSVLSAEADGKGLVAAEKFPIKLVGGRHLHRDDPMCLLLDQQGFIEESDAGVHVRAEVIEAFILKTTTTTTRTSLSSGIKNTSKKTSEFVFESGHPSGMPLAFLPQIGPRVRAGMVAQVVHLGHEQAQLVILEVASRVKTGGLKGDAVSYTRGIVSKASRGQFVPAAGLQLADELDLQLQEVSRNQEKAALRIVK